MHERQQCGSCTAAAIGPSDVGFGPNTLIDTKGGLRTFAALANGVRGLGVKQTLGFGTVLLDQFHFTSEMWAHEYYAIRHLPSD